MNSKIIENITPSQRKLIASGGMVIGVFFILWLITYLPIKKRIDGLKSELGNAQNQIHTIEEIIGPDKTIEQGMRMLEEKYQKLAFKFPQREEEALRLLSDFARKQNITVDSIKSQPKTLFLDANGQKAEIGGKSCQLLSVSIVMKSGYKDLFAYIQTLKELLPAYITIERLEIGRDTSGTSKLNVSLNLTMYLLS